MLSKRIIVAKALERLPDLLPLIRNWRLETRPPPTVESPAVDILTTGPLGRRTIRLAIQVSPTGEPRPVRSAIAHLRASLAGSRHHAYPIVVAPYIGPRAAKICAAEGIGYFDLSGNARLSYLTLFVRDENHPNLFPRPAEQRSVFTRKASRILRALLVHPDRVWDQTTLAQEARTSHAHVHKVIASLVEEDLVDRPPRGPIRLTNPSVLLDLWRDRYSLRRHRLLRFFRLAPSTSDLMRALASDLERLRIRFAFSQATGASLVSPYATFTVVALYADCEPAALTRLPDLRPVDAGTNVLVYLPDDPGVFDYPASSHPFPVVSTIQLYLDLFHSDGRGRDAAQWLRQEKIGF